ncbi:hypothetical protein D9M71_682400 [compost metagenome]
MRGHNMYLDLVVKLGADLIISHAQFPSNGSVKDHCDRVLLGKVIGNGRHDHDADKIVS